MKVVANPRGHQLPEPNDFSQIGNLPQIGVKIKNIWNHHLVMNRIFPTPKPRIRGSEHSNLDHLKYDDQTHYETGGESVRDTTVYLKMVNLGTGTP